MEQIQVRLILFFVFYTLDTTMLTLFWSALQQIPYHMGISTGPMLLECETSLWTCLSVRRLARWSVCYNFTFHAPIGALVILFGKLLWKVYSSNSHISFPLFSCALGWLVGDQGRQLRAEPRIPWRIRLVSLSTGEVYKVSSSPVKISSSPFNIGSSPGRWRD